MTLSEMLHSQGFVILDGALATALEQRGADLADALWSARILLEAPQMIRQLHYDYFAAGADVAITASYQASLEGFARRGLGEEEAARLMRESVHLAQAARDDFWAQPSRRAGRERPLVAASIGPYGAFLADGSEYRGAYGLSKDELKAWHRPRMAALAEAGPDLLACETIPALVEGEALAELLGEFDLPGWLSFSCRDGAHTAQGEPFTQAAALAEESSHVVAVGINCTPPPFVADLLAAARPVTGKPLLAYPNSGESWDAANHCWLPGTGGTDFGEAACLWRDAGAVILGGCCRTGPDDIRTMRRALLTLRANPSA